MVPHRREHPPYLMVSPLGDLQGDVRIITYGKLCREAGAFFAIEDQRPRGEDLPFAPFQRSFQCRFVDFSNVVARGGEAVEERSVVGEEEQSARLFVEPSDGGEFGITKAPTRGEEIIDESPFPIIVGADQSERFVHQDDHPHRGIEGFAVEEDFVMGDFGIAF